MGQKRATVLFLRSWWIDPHPTLSITLSLRERGFTLVILRAETEESPCALHVILRECNDQRISSGFLEILRFAQDDVTSFLVILRERSDRRIS